MSADLYTSEIDSDEYGELFLEIKVDGNLRIRIRDFVRGFTLPPTPEGWKKAENLIGALQEWVRHTKELEEQRIWAEGLTKGMDR
jgi:hypothetical protein